MASPPIPQRIAPLRWRRPSVLWTPLALALAIGWPALLFYQDAPPQRLALVAGGAVFALALVSLGASWALGHPPRARRIVVVHVVIAGAIAALVAPFVLTHVLSAVAEYQDASGREAFNFAMALTMVPLALVLGLPIALISGIVFAWAALERPRGPPGQVLDDDVFRNDAQPFR